MGPVSSLSEEHMSHELQKFRTCTTHLLPSARSVRLTGMTIARGFMVRRLMTTALITRCPHGAMPSSSVHSR